MWCKKFQLMIQRSLDGELGEVESRFLEEHLKGCRDCSRFLDQARRLKDSFRPAIVEPPPALRPRILARMKAEAAGRDTAEAAGRRATEPNGVIVLFRRAAAAALVFLALSAGIFFGRIGPLTADEREVHYEDLFTQREPGAVFGLLIRTDGDLKEALRLLEPAALKKEEP
jgi:anti-sigma factor RsiW